MTASSSVQLSWMSGSNGGSRILGFVLYHRRHHSVEWASRQLSAVNRSHVVSNLRCGSEYSFYLTAFNRLGEGRASHVIHVATNGSGTTTFCKLTVIGRVQDTRAGKRLGFLLPRDAMLARYMLSLCVC